MSSPNRAYRPGQQPATPVTTGPPPGVEIPFNRGYDARSRARAPVADTGRSANGYLYSPALGAQVDLWVTDVAADFSVSGQTAQSRMLREFFPRSFNDVTVVITGNVASTQEYNRLATFVRHAQWQGLANVDSGVATDQTLTFVLNDKTPTSWGRHRTTTDVRIKGESSEGVQSTVKGRHLPWKVSGFIRRVEAGATALEVAPEFVLEFVVVESDSPGYGIWGEVLDKNPATLSTFLQLLNRAKSRKDITLTADPVNSKFGPPKPKPPVQQGVGSVSDAIGWSVQGAVSVLKTLGL